MRRNLGVTVIQRLFPAMIDQNSQMVIQNVKDTMVGLQDATTNLINDVMMYWFVI